MAPLKIRVHIWLPHRRNCPSCDSHNLSDGDLKFRKANVKTESLRTENLLTHVVDSPQFNTSALSKVAGVQRWRYLGLTTRFLATEHARGLL